LPNGMLSFVPLQIAAVASDGIKTEMYWDLHVEKGLLPQTSLNTLGLTEYQGREAT